MIGATDPEHKAKIIQALLEYCKLDTYAMVELYWRLSALAKLEAA